eukprot:4413915-Amphidinium_carterae.1
MATKGNRPRPWHCEVSGVALLNSRDTIPIGRSVQLMFTQAYWVSHFTSTVPQSAASPSTSQWSVVILGSLVTVQLLPSFVFVGLAGPFLIKLPYNCLPGISCFASTPSGHGYRMAGWFA